MKIYLMENGLPRLETDRLVLRAVCLPDISEEYVSWLNDPVVTQFLEIRFARQSRSMVEKYIQAHLDDVLLSKHFGVFVEKAGKEILVGTTTLNSINQKHGTADLSFVMGHPWARGRGFATESVHAVCAYMLLVEKFYKITGGIYRDNMRSQRVFCKNNFSLEGILREQCIYDEHKRNDILLYGLLSREFSPNPVLLGDNGQILFV